MSYCRFSSMNWRCDVYVYQDTCGGWTTHVAGRRRILPAVPDIAGGRLSMWLHEWSGWKWDNERRIGVCPVRWRGKVYGAWSRFTAFWHTHIHLGSLHLIPLRDIGLPHDGESFNDATPGECADRLERLRAMGYKVPQFAIDSLRKEAIVNLLDGYDSLRVQSQRDIAPGWVAVPECEWDQVMRQVLGE